MAHSKIIMTNGTYLKTAPIGYSWTMFFFGFIPPLLRGEFLIAICVFVLNWFTFGFGGMIYAFWFNKHYLKGLFNNGYYIHKHDSLTTDDTIKAYIGALNLPTAR